MKRLTAWLVVTALVALWAACMTGSAALVMWSIARTFERAGATGVPGVYASGCVTGLAVAGAAALGCILALRRAYQRPAPNDCIIIHGPLRYRTTRGDSGVLREIGGAPCTTS